MVVVWCVYLKFLFSSFSSQIPFFLLLFFSSNEFVPVYNAFFPPSILLSNSFFPPSFPSNSSLPSFMHTPAHTDAHAHTHTHTHKSMPWPKKNWAWPTLTHRFLDNIPKCRVTFEILHETYFVRYVLSRRLQIRQENFRKLPDTDLNHLCRKTGPSHPPLGAPSGPPAPKTVPGTNRLPHGRDDKSLLTHLPADAAEGRGAGHFCPFARSLMKPRCLPWDRGQDA